jgi:hypothetical protein
MKSLSQAAGAKLTASTQINTPVPVQDLHLEVSAAIWQSMVERMMSGK